MPTAMICTGCAADLTGQVAATWKDHRSPCDVCGEAHPTCRHAREAAADLRREFRLYDGDDDDEVTDLHLPDGSCCNDDEGAPMQPVDRYVINDALGSLLNTLGRELPDDVLDNLTHHVATVIDANAPEGDGDGATGG